MIENFEKIREGPGVINWTKQFLSIQVDIDNATVKTTDGKHLSSYVENSSCIMWLTPVSIVGEQNGFDGRFAH
jgi:hypothetical protein